MAEAARVEEKQDLKLAHEAMRECDNDLDQAVASLRMKLHGDWQAADPYLMMGCYEACRKCRSDANRSLVGRSPALRSIPTEPKHEPASGNMPPSGKMPLASVPAPEQEEPTRRLRNYVATLLDYYLPSGVMLRDATKEEILAGAEFHLKQSRTMRVTGLWLKAVAEKLKKDQTAAEVFSSDALREMRARIEDDAE